MLFKWRSFVGRVVNLLLLIFIKSFRLPKNRGDIIARFSKKVRIFAPRNGLLYHVENVTNV